MKFIFTVGMLFSLGLAAQAAEWCERLNSPLSQVMKDAQLIRANASIGEGETSKEINQQFAYEICDSPYGGHQAKMALLKEADSLRDQDQIEELFRSHHEKVKCPEQQKKMQFNAPTFAYPDPACTYTALPDLELLSSASHKVKQILNPRIKNHFVKTSKLEALYEVTDSAGNIQYLSVQTPIAAPPSKSKLSKASRNYSLGQIVEMKKLPDGSFENYLRSPGASMGGSHLCNFPYAQGS